MNQEALFYDTLEEALSPAIDAMGGRKVVACDLWPRKPPREAHNRLNACLNSEKEDKFDSCDLVYLLKRAREIGAHGAMRFLCAQAGYAEPVPVEPQDERAQLQRAFIESVKTQAKIAERLGVWDKLPSHLTAVGK